MADPLTAATVSYGYNADGDLTSEATTGYAGAASTTYGYNEADQLAAAPGGISYGYDALGRLDPDHEFRHGRLRLLRHG